MSAATEFAKAFRLEPGEALAYLRGRDTRVTTDWRDLWQPEHAREFTISRLTRADLLDTIRKGIVDSVGGDLSRTDWLKDTQAMLEKAGWWGEQQVIDAVTGEAVTTTFNARRLKLIFDANARTAYAAGQWKRLQQTKRSHPYLRYIALLDGRTRPEHAAWHNLTLPIDHPFWRTHFIPNGWNCRCRVVAVSQAEYDRGVAPDGSPLIKEAPALETRPWFNARTSETIQVPVGIDPGWAYNVGEADQQARAMDNLVKGKLAGLDPEIAKVARAARMSLPTGGG